jgi:hypothetical protein
MDNDTHHTNNLKGQCHEMVVEMSPWSSNSGLDKWSHTLFFFLKIGHFKTTTAGSGEPVFTSMDALLHGP